MHILATTVCVNLKNSKEYEEVLNNIESISPLSEKQKNIAKIIFTTFQQVHLFANNIENNCLMPKTSHTDKLTFI